MIPASGVIVLTVGLLIGGVVGSLLPRIPGAVFSLAGVYLYWWESGLTMPATTTVVLLSILGLLALIGRLFGTVTAGRFGGVSTVTATIAGLVGFVCFLFLGTIGLVLGTIVTAFLIEYLRLRSLRRGFVAALFVVLGSFASTAMQVLLTGAILGVMLFVILV